MKMPNRNFLFLSLLACAFSFGPARARAADHADSPVSANNASADLGDVYFYLDPNDNSRAILEMTVRGFIVPGEAVNMGIFDPDVTYQFRIEGTGDAVPDAAITVNFSPRTSTASGQVATVRMNNREAKLFEFTAPATAPSLRPSPPPQVVTTDPASGVSFFAGEVDDPFFFDIPAFGRFVASVLAGSPDPTVFDRGRDTFAGYNIMAIALSLPVALLPQSDSVVGLEAVTLRGDQHGGSLLANLSARGRVDRGEEVLIGGLIISGNSLKRIVVRAIGPSLGSSGIDAALADPKLAILNDQAQVVATNDDWQDTQAGDISASGLAPTNAKESAIVVTLAPGAYTAVVRGANGATGIAVVETYDLDSGAATRNGELRQIDREGVPAINVVGIPVARKDEYNTGTPQQDAAGRFAGDIVNTLKALGTNDSNIGILADIAVAHGDYLRLNLNIANAGLGGGNNSSAGFPNGRRLGDDVIDTLLSLVTNGSEINDNVDANDVPLRDTFPFFALSQQPREAGVIDDNTRN